MFRSLRLVGVDPTASNRGFSEDIPALNQNRGFPAILIEAIAKKLGDGFRDRPTERLPRAGTPAACLPFEAKT